MAIVALTAAGFANRERRGGEGKAKVTYKNLSYKDFSLNYAAMKALKPLAAKGKGSVAVILPDTTSSTRYTEFDAPMLKTAFTDAGLKTSQIIIQNGQGSDSTFITDAQADITERRQGDRDRPRGLGDGRHGREGRGRLPASRSSTTTA